jgi:long-chain acyl-CoA synthetase
LRSPPPSGIGIGFGVGSGNGRAALAERRRSIVAETLLFRALRDRLGFTRLRSAATGGAALGPDTFRFFRALGIPLRQLYGQTELMGAYTLHPDDDVDFDSVGVGFWAGIEMRIEAPDADGVGEVVTRHPNVFLGYYKDHDSTAADLRGGWMYTGDAGYFNAAGHLVVIDRTDASYPFGRR